MKVSKLELEMLAFNFVKTSGFKSNSQIVKKEYRITLKTFGLCGSSSLIIIMLIPLSLTVTKCRFTTTKDYLKRLLA